MPHKAFRLYFLRCNQNTGLFLKLYYPAVVWSSNICVTVYLLFVLRLHVQAKIFKMFRGMFEAAISDSPPKTLIHCTQVSAPRLSNMKNHYFV